jgi:hypothetical protein
MDAAAVQALIAVEVANAAITATTELNAALDAAALTAADNAAAAALVATNELNAAVAAAVLAVPAPHGPPPPPAPVVFSLSPGVTSPNVPWDYSTSAGIKLFFNAISPLSPKYKGDERTLKVLLSGLTSKSTQFGWTQLIMMIEDGSGVARDLMKHYTLITKENVRTHALTYIGGQSRAAQASAQLAGCILASMDDVFLVKLLTKTEDYTVNGVEDGPSMLKSLISIVSIETKSRVPLIKRILGNLGKVMKEEKSKITEFNLRVNDLMSQLYSADEDYGELLDKLFEAYQMVSDKTFVAYIQDKQSRWEESELEITTSELMTQAENRYKTMKSRETWNAATKEESELIAMRAQLTDMVAMNAELKKIKKDFGPKGPGRPKEPRTKDDAKWGWKLIAPTDDQPKEKSFDGKEYVYCPFHLETRWVLKKNHADGCRNDPKMQSGGTPSKDAEPSKKALQYAKALMNVMEPDDDDELPDEVF